MSSVTGNLLVAAIDLGTTHSIYGFSFKSDYKRNPTRVSTKRVWMKNNLASLKTSTCVLCYPNGEFSSFGYDAEHKYAELVANDEHHKWYYFRRLRMALYENKIQKGFEVEDEKGLRMPARKVFGMAIRYLKEDMLRTLKLQLNADDIHWILTVPAIWTDSAKQFIREAADEAGIDGDNLSIALEPGAAATYCQLTISDCLPSTGGYDDSIYMVIDIGGETVDITVHEKQADGSIHEVHIASSGECGGNIVDEEFHQMLMKIVGNSVLLTFCERNMHDYMDMREEFERKKRVLCTDSNDKIFITVPDPLINIYEKLNGETIQNATFQYPHEGKFQWKRNKMVFEADLFRSLFQTHISKITEFIAEIMDRPGVKGTTTFLMVGEFSEYRLIQEAVMKAFPTVKVVKPVEAELVVLKGAVILGHMICEARNKNFQLQLPTNKDHSTMTTRFDNAVPSPKQNTVVSRRPRRLIRFDDYTPASALFTDTTVTSPKQNTVESKRPHSWNRMDYYTRVSPPLTDTAVTSPKQNTVKSRTTPSGNRLGDNTPGSVPLPDIATTSPKQNTIVSKSESRGNCVLL